MGGRRGPHEGQGGEDGRKEARTASGDATTRDGGATGYRPRVRVLVARCEIAYEGRLQTRLRPATASCCSRRTAAWRCTTRAGPSPSTTWAARRSWRRTGTSSARAPRELRRAADDLLQAVHADTRHELQDGAALEREAASSSCTP